VGLDRAEADVQVVGALVLMAIPIFMVVASTTLPAPAALEVAVLALIIRTAWTWPRTTRPSSDVETSRPLRTARTT
jgi:hypothetical protein